MKLSELEKEIITKYAKIVDCKWFELATKTNGDDCVFDKEEKIHIPLLEGIINLAWYMAEIEDIYLNDKSFTIVEEDSKIYILDKLNNKKLKSGLVIRLFASRFKSIEEMNNTMTSKEKAICMSIFHKARMERKRIRNKNS
jgi:hypothetical protein